jgi:hypothetical protein
MMDPAVNKNMLILKPWEGLLLKTLELHSEIRAAVTMKDEPKKTAEVIITV